ncbi:MAG: HAMP domain-containing histidine kinase [Clostridia bacterium]|nr:HAMP domain-containing histidine kinase [Clostridia bacterium]
MFGKTKRRIVFAIVSSLFILLAVTLTVIVISNRIALRRRNAEMLRTYVDSYVIGGPKTDPAEPEPGAYVEGRDGPPPDGKKPEEGPGRDRKNDSAFRLSTFYSVAFSETGEILEISNESRGALSDESLTAAASKILAGGRSEGSFESRYYLVDKRDGYTLVAMIDETINDLSQRTLIRQMLIFGSAALVILFLISIFIAKRIVKPLEENDSRQKNFISDAGHELKTPIAVISANCELLKRETGECEWLSNIEYENERMSELVKRLLELSRSERGSAVTGTVDLSETVAGEALPFESLAYEKGVSIDTDIESGIFVNGDPGQLKQLVSILLDNALSYGTGDRVSLKLKREKHSALLSVSNAADPSIADKLPFLFDRFYRADSSHADSGSHFGLGLSIAKAVAESHGGGILAAYRDGYAVFTVTLPSIRPET